mmetsp:Transcript_29796/g.70802  ORF Transcript_29796/g.70802 Transcript_29796/m.70802 type:complete len:120 (+) Transcript_29796:151-510(+)
MAFPRREKDFLWDVAERVVADVQRNQFRKLDEAQWQEADVISVQIDCDQAGEFKQSCWKLRRISAQSAISTVRSDSVLAENKDSKTFVAWDAGSLFHRLCKLSREILQAFVSQSVVVQV